jgi:ribosomal protein S27AE
MKCPTCGKASLVAKKGPRRFRGKIITMKWRECPECGEKLYAAKDVREAERKTKLTDHEPQ